jgi:hypothetical protein
VLNLSVCPTLTTHVKRCGPKISSASATVTTLVPRKSHHSFQVSVGVDKRVEWPCLGCVPETIIPKLINTKGAIMTPLQLVFSIGHVKIDSPF